MLIRLHQTDAQGKRTSSCRLRRLVPFRPVLSYDADPTSQSPAPAPARRMQAFNRPIRAAAEPVPSKNVYIHGKSVSAGDRDGATHTESNGKDEHDTRTIGRGRG